MIEKKTLQEWIEWAEEIDQNSDTDGSQYDIELIREVPYLVKPLKDEEAVTKSPTRKTQQPHTRKTKSEIVTE